MFHVKQKQRIIECLDYIMRWSILLLLYKSLRDGYRQAKACFQPDGYHSEGQPVWARAHAAGGKCEYRLAWRECEARSHAETYKVWLRQTWHAGLFYKSRPQSVHELKPVFKVVYAQATLPCIIMDRRNRRELRIHIVDCGSLQRRAIRRLMYMVLPAACHIVLS